MPITMYRMRVLSAVALGLALSMDCAAAPLTLLQAYQAALQNDPTYRGAINEHKAGQENVNLGRSRLLPRLSISYAANKNNAEITTTQTSFGQTFTNTTHPTYTGVNAALVLRQPLVNFEALASYKQGVAQTEYSDAQFAGRSQDLMLRLVAAYADAQYNEDQLALAIAQRDAYLEQMHVNERMFKLGEGTKTDMLETQARASLAQAQVLEARDTLATARNTLAGIVGLDVTELAPLNKNFRVLPVKPASVQAWLDIAMQKNAEIVALGYALEAAHQEVNRQRAGHFPNVDFVASRSKQDSASINTYNQDANVNAVGVEINIPLFAGGYVSAATRQAAANYEKARNDLDAKKNQISVELHKQFGLMQSSEPRIDALMKSVESARLLVIATKQSIKGGVRINLDLLNAQQQLYTAQRDLALARYNYMLAYLRMRNAAGTLEPQDLTDIAKYFVAAP